MARQIVRKQRVKQVLRKLKESVTADDSIDWNIDSPKYFVATE